MIKYFHLKKWKSDHISNRDQWLLPQEDTCVLCTACRCAENWNVDNVPNEFKFGNII